jgi:hypothetical protein
VLKDSQGRDDLPCLGLTRISTSTSQLDIGRDDLPCLVAVGRSDPECPLDPHLDLDLP